MKIYISGSFADRARLQELAKLLVARGHEVTSSWLTEPIIKHESEHATWEKRARANEDLLDVERSDAVLLVTLVDSTTGGYHVETGMAMMARKPIYLVGPRRNVFAYSNLMTSKLPSNIQDAVDRVFFLHGPLH